MNNLEKKLRYQFKNKSILKLSLSHRSYANENKSGDNEVLEFLGDSILGMVVGHMLVEKYPKMNEGQLSLERAKLVSQTSLANLARSINLDKHVLLGNGERNNGGAKKDSILADTFEALIAAIYKDSNFETVQKIINLIFKL